MGRDGQSVVEKVRKVLDCYVTDGVGALTFAELLDGTVMSRATLHRTLSEMVAQGFLVQTGLREEYRLGPLLRSAAAVTSGASSLPGLARPHMERLRDACRETIVLAELHGPHVVPVARVDGLHEMRMNQEVGKRYPAHAGATGKVLLAQLEPGELDSLLEQMPLERLTPATVSKQGALRADLRPVAAAGAGISIGERVPEAVAISAPVRGPAPGELAALTISGISSRYERDRLVAEATMVRDAARAISAEAGADAPAPGADDAAAREALERMCDAAWSRRAAV